MRHLRSSFFLTISSFRTQRNARRRAEHRTDTTVQLDSRRRNERAWRTSIQHVHLRAPRCRRDPDWPVSRHMNAYSVFNICFSEIFCNIRWLRLHYHHRKAIAAPKDTICKSERPRLQNRTLWRFIRDHINFLRLPFPAFNLIL